MQNKKEFHVRINKMLKRLQDTHSEYENFTMDNSHMKYSKRSGKKKKNKDMSTNMEELTRQEDGIDLSQPSKNDNSDLSFQNFPEHVKLQEAFKLDPLSQSTFTRTGNYSSSGKLPSLSTHDNNRDSFMNTYLSQKLFGKKKKSQINNANIGPKEIKLDPSRVVVFKKGRLLENGYFIIEFSYTNSYFWVAAFDIETNEYFARRLTPKETEAVFIDFENNYDTIASAIQIKGNQIVIPKIHSEQ